MQKTYLILLALILLSLVASFATSLMLPKRFQNSCALLATVLTTLSAVLAIVFLFTAYSAPDLVMEVQWFSINDLKISANLLINRQSAVMLAVVTLISALVHAYSIGYMHQDSKPNRYYAFLGFFTASMCGIVLSENLLLLFVFWELVGFSSYILIGHFSERPVAAQAASRAFIINRIGDAFFLTGLIIIWNATGTLDLGGILGAPDFEYQEAACICLFMGVIGKSAQLPLFIWLPEAMEGPTPVSALIHAATMVAAGVYLLVRINDLLPASVLNLISIVGFATSVSGALFALSEFNLKRILAFSTMSQLGLMIFAVGMGAPEAALTHLVTHAFFKACLFLCAGSVIHACTTEGSEDNLDIRKLQIRGQMPLTSLAFCIGAGSLAGIPFFGGFQSKEAIVHSLSEMNKWTGVAGILLVSMLTIFYTFRLVWFLLIRRITSSLIFRESPVIMTVPISILATGSLWFLVSPNPFSFDGWLISGAGSLSTIILSSSVILISLSTCIFLFSKQPSSLWSLSFTTASITEGYDLLAQGIITVLTKITSAGDRLINGSTHVFGYATATAAHAIAWLDRVLVDGTINGAARTVMATGSSLKRLQSGKIQAYILLALLSIIILVFTILH